MQDSVSIGVQEDAQATPGRVALRDPQRSVDVRSASLAIIAVLASLYALRWASAVVIPVLLGLMVSYALTPLVNRLQVWRIPRARRGRHYRGNCRRRGLDGPLARGRCHGDGRILAQAAQKLQRSMHGARGEPEGPIAKVRRAAAKLEQAAEATASVAPPGNQQGAPL